MPDQKASWILRGEPFRNEENGNEDEFPAILAHLIKQRKIIGSENLKEFLQPKLKNLADPFLLPEMDLAVREIFSAIDQKKNICIFGDYDVDGVTSITVMKSILKAYGHDARHFIPRRGVEGYGLSLAALKRCMMEGEKPDLLIAVDCGTSSVNEIAQLKKRGIHVVVIDHHEMNALGKPDCNALVNPKLGDSFHYLCAAAVCFKVAHALIKIRPLDTFDLKNLLELVSVATIADIVPMIGENRLIVRHGLKRMPQTLNLGLKALQQSVGLSDHVTSMDIGFRIGPRLNAAGRMDQPEDALAILLTNCEIEAAEWADRLEEYNRERQNLEETMRREALEMMELYKDDSAIVLSSRDWHPGVVGIVASRLMRQYHKPAFVVSIDENGLGKGSGRSIEGVSLVQAIAATSDFLEAGGGHDMAAGISVRENKIDDFRKKFTQYVSDVTTEKQLIPRLYLDAELGFDLLELEFLKSYELLQPFGSGNPQPIFYSTNVALSRAPIKLKNKHLRLFLRQGIHERSAMFFNGGDRDLPEPPWDMAFTIDRNTFRGVTNLQIVIQDIRAAQVINI
jgi:single-stranded-DNA-specific exonuclease